MYFDYTGGGGSWTGRHDAVGAAFPSSSWYFAEGYTGPGFDEYVCVLNPGTADATLTFNFQTQEAGLIVPDGTYTVPAHSRATFKANELLGNQAYQTSLKLVSDAPVVAERPMYFDYQGTGSWGWTGGHCVIGARAQCTGWFFAEGYTGDNFEEWLCIQNPGIAAAQVIITYYPEGGTSMVKDAVTVPANSRATVNVNTDAGAGLSICAGVWSDQPVIVERPMYFNFRGAWSGGHDVVGYLP